MRLHAHLAAALLVHAGLLPAQLNPADLSAMVGCVELLHAVQLTIAPPPQLHQLLKILLHHQLKMQSLPLQRMLQVKPTKKKQLKPKESRKPVCLRDVNVEKAHLRKRKKDGMLPFFFVGFWQSEPFPVLSLAC